MRYTNCLTLLLSRPKVLALFEPREVGFKHGRRLPPTRTGRVHHGPTRPRSSIRTLRRNYLEPRDGAARTRGTPLEAAARHELDASHEQLAANAAGRARGLRPDLADRDRRGRRQLAAATARRLIIASTCNGDARAGVYAEPSANTHPGFSFFTQQQNRSDHVLPLLVRRSILSFMSHSLLNAFREQNPILVGALCDIAERVAREPQHADSSVPPRAYIVGGYVRDLLLGVEPKDADLEVFGVPADRLHSLLETLFPSQVHDVGRAFGVLKVHLSHGVEFDVAMPRTESKTAPGHKGFAVESYPFLSIREAARRRDFTINTISFDPLTGEVLDPWNGQQDLEARLLRVVDAETFVDDPLRVYRAVQFLARFQLTIDPPSFLLLQQMVRDGHLQELSHERITEELGKLFLLAEKPSLGIECLRALGIIERDYPELNALINVPQEPEWHPEGDVWIHTMLVVDQAAKIIRRNENADFTRDERLAVVFGALCHDLGKPATTVRGEKDGVMRWRTPGHQEAGEAPTRELCGRLSFGEHVTHAAVMIALHHLRPPEYYLKHKKGELTDARYANTIRTLLKKIAPLSWRVLHAAAEADFRGRGFVDAETRAFLYGDLFRDTIIREQLDVEALKPLILGGEVIELFSLEPGPFIGDLLRTVEHARDKGEIQTKDEALVLIGMLIKNRGHH